MKFIFECAEHEEFGSLGWKLKGASGMDPLGGMAVAHDCLEHFTAEDGVHHEFMALGASLFVRGPYYYSRKGRYESNPGVHIASDLPGILHHVQNEGYSFQEAPRTRSLDSEVVEGWIDRMFQKFHSNCEEYAHEDLRLTAEDERNIRSWMRIGYRKAVKRYRGRDGEAMNLFCYIENAADKALRGCGGGEELEVCVNFSTLTAYILGPD